MKPVDIALGLTEVLNCIESSEIEYMIVGSVAGTIYGEPRLTNDLDLVISMATSAASKLLSAFSPDEFYIPPIEIIQQEVTRGGQTNFLHLKSGVKIDLMFKKATPHARAEFERRRRIEILKGLQAWIAAPEDVIIAKLRFYRDGESEKHLVDIRGILTHTAIDRQYLDSWIDSLALGECFAKI